MTKDRMPSLIAAGNSTNGVDTVDFSDNNSNLEQCEDLLVFLREVDVVRTMIQRIRNLVGDINKKNSAILSAYKIDEGVRKDVESISQEIKHLGNKVWHKLKKMEKNLDSEKSEKFPAEEKIRNIQHSALTKVFHDLMTEYNLAQVDHQERCKRRFQRQLEITGVKSNSIDDDEVENMMTPMGLFTHHYKKLAHVEARHDDIIKLEKSIVELHSLFMEMARRVDTQGEVINRIETHVAGSKASLRSALIETKEALGYK